MADSFQPPSLVLVVATLACCCTCWRAVQCSADMSSKGLEEIEVFVRSVLAVARSYDLGIPERLPARAADTSAAMADGPLPDDMRRYLERLVSDSLAVDRRTLVTMLLDDALIVEEDQEPHRVFDRVHGGRKPEAPVKKPVVRMPKKT